jgi:hypothetical protein
MCGARVTNCDGWFEVSARSSWSEDIGVTLSFAVRASTRYETALNQPAQFDIIAGPHRAVNAGRDFQSPRPNGNAQVSASLCCPKSRRKESFAAPAALSSSEQAASSSARSPAETVT